MKWLLGSGRGLSFLFFFFFIFFLLAPRLFAQVDPDPSRPFDQGQVVSLPGTNGYVGDLPHSISMIDGETFHTISGNLATEVGWTDITGPSQPGLRSIDPGILFEGIAYPFASTLILDSMPQMGTIDILDFPASAWWGPSAAAGAIQIEPKNITAHNEDRFGVWGSDAGPWGAEDLFQGRFLSLEGNYLHGNEADSIGTGNFDIISKELWTKGDGAQFESGFLGMESGSQLDWYSAFADLKIDSPNFQTLELKPYFQSAQLGSSTAREAGGFLDYLFNMAGIAEGHVGAGFSHEDLGSNAGSTQANREFVQATGLVDVLGPINFDSAIRLDFSSVADSQFSALLGLQMVQGYFTFTGDYSKGVMADSLGDVQQADLGAAFQPTSEWETSLKYIHLAVGSGGMDGGRLEVGMDRADPFLYLFRRIKLRLIEQFFQGPDGSALFDTGGQLSFSPFPRARLNLRARVLSDQGVFGEVGAEYSATDHISLFASLANLNNLPEAWPDAAAPAGRVLRAGLQGEF